MRVWYLHCDVESRDVKGLEHDLCRVLSVLRGVQGRLRLKTQIPHVYYNVKSTHTGLECSRQVALTSGARRFDSVSDIGTDPVKI